MMNLLKVIILCLFTSSCAYIELVSKGSKQSFDGYKRLSLPVKDKFILTDGSGEFTLRRHIGLAKNKNLVSKLSLETNAMKSGVVEKTVAISVPDKVSELNIYRPHMSATSVWFQGQASKTMIKEGSRRGFYEIYIKEPGSSRKETFEVSPNIKLTCFYSQLIRCLERTGYFERVSKGKRVTVRFGLIIDSYPFFADQYPGFPNQPLLEASFYPDGRVQKGEIRFRLELPKTIIAYVLDQNAKLKDKYWVSQGLQLREVR